MRVAVAALRAAEASVEAREAGAVATVGSAAGVETRAEMAAVGASVEVVEQAVRRAVGTRAVAFCMVPRRRRVASAKTPRRGTGRRSHSSRHQDRSGRSNLSSRIACRPRRCCSGSQSPALRTRTPPAGAADTAAAEAMTVEWAGGADGSGLLRT